ncbi:TonB-dependent receptor domain-containing protein [Geofilum sp. OHC36d9]|uniref:TonB-dependent receptor domain-containing protein n=1 Tax=Geofilum sp. OHC36d9 TaxID=3458413 RepID=UPI00403380C3
MSKQLLFGHIVFFWVMIFLSQSVIAQERRGGDLSGTVVSSTGESLPGVTLLLTELNYGTVTDIDGGFEFKDVAKGTYVLQASYMGFETVRKTVSITNDPSKINIVLGETSYTMDDVVVTGKSATRLVSEQAYQVSSVSARDLFNSTADAKVVMNRISGVRIREEGGLGSNMDFTLNGFSGDQVKFFMDGIPMDNFGASLGLSDLPVNMIERVDVYKGVVPVWLGTDALGGAVNIVTNRKSNYLDVSYSYGSFNTHRASVNGAYTNSRTGFTVRGNAFYNYSDNNYDVLAEIVENNTVVDTAEVERFHDRYRSGTVKFESGYVNKPWADNFLLGLVTTASDKEVQHGATMSTVYGGIVQNSHSLIPTLRYNKKNLLVGGLDVSLYSALNFSESQVVDTLSGVRYNWLGQKSVSRTSDGQVSDDGEFLKTLSTLNEDEFTSQLNAGYAISDQSSMAVNYAVNYFKRKAFDLENPDNIDNKYPKSLLKQVLGLAYKLDVGSRLSTTLFGKFFSLRATTSKEFDFALETQRVEAVESYKQEFGFGLASTYNLLPDFQVKASYERTNRMPMPLEIFGDGLFVDANPDLGPERSHNVNLGIEYRYNQYPKHQLEVGSSFVYRKASDLIYTVVTVSSPMTHYDNLSSTRVYGVEGNIKYQWNNKFHVSANVTYQDITDQAERVYNNSYTGTGWQKNYHYGFRLPNKPYFFWNANAGMSVKAPGMSGGTLNVNYFLTYVERYFLTWAEFGSSNDKYVIPRQISHGLEMGYSWQNARYNLSVACDNLLDARLYDKYYLQKPGRSFSIKLRYSL